MDRLIFVVIALVVVGCIVLVRIHFANSHDNNYVKALNPKIYSLRLYRQVKKRLIWQEVVLQAICITVLAFYSVNTFM